MNYWIIPGSNDVFRVDDYFETNDVVDWKQSHYLFEVGDIVYIYVSAPISRIKYMLRVEKTDIPYEDTMVDTEYWARNHPKEKELQHITYVRLKLLGKCDTPLLSLKTLSEYGVTSLQGARRNLPKELIAHIQQCFECSTKNE